jgi:hypothetical protein
VARLGVTPDKILLLGVHVGPLLKQQPHHASCPYPAANHSGVSPFMNFPVALEIAAGNSRPVTAMDSYKSILEDVELGNLWGLDPASGFECGFAPEQLRLKGNFRRTRTKTQV